MIGAGSVVYPNTTIPDDELWVGNPAQYLRPVSVSDKEFYEEIYYHQDKVKEIINHTMSIPEQILDFNYREQRSFEEEEDLRHLHVTNY